MEKPSTATAITATTAATTTTARSSSSHVTRAIYPLPQPLVERLQAGILLLPAETANNNNNNNNNNNQNTKIVVDTIPDALSHLVSNAIEALDVMYYATMTPLLATVRRQRRRKQQQQQQLNDDNNNNDNEDEDDGSRVLAHRLCLRVHASPENGTLSLTDLGAGMTRTDLINSLGIGRAGLLSTTTTATKTSAMTSKAGSSVVGTDDDDDSSTTTVDDDDDDDSEEEEEEEESTEEESSLEQDGEETETENEEEDGNNGQNGAEQNGKDISATTNNKNARLSSSSTVAAATTAVAAVQPVVDCRATSIGGFYAALCALGTGVRLCTKSKYDDYYEFEIGMDVPVTDEKHYSESIQQFQVARPLEEGAVLSAENGFDQFHHIRGDSGTCVTIRLNQKAIDEGLLDEDKLRPMFLKILETTQYTVAFSSDPNAQEIIDASQKEMDWFKTWSTTVAATDDNDDDLTMEAAAGADSSWEMVATATDDDDDHLRSRTNGSHNSVKERAKYIPLRLSLGERKMLRLVEASMNCCDYTTRVDRPSFKSAARRTHEQLKGVTSVLRGLVTACDYEAGQKLLLQEDAADDDNDNNNNNTYAEYESFFRQMFEITRRHKIMNPEKMRTEYGKMVYMLQDAVSPSVRPHLGFSVIGPIETVYKFLEERGGLDMLSDKLIETATEEILALNKSRATIESQIRQKERAVNLLKRKYQSARLSADDIHLCLYSICDNNSFLNSNRVPIDKIIDYLTTHFSPNKIEEGYSLSIVSGEEGSRLSHSHERQYYYALQSLTLWRDIIDDMFRLWAMAEDDLLSESITYSLQDTGQGMQRVQQSPRAYKAMQQVLQRVQTNVGHWVGSSVVHLGDHNVPNALSFIDKYTQVPRILGPIVSCLENLERIYSKDEGIRTMIDNGFGGIEKLRKDILYDFFRSAFDGSGSDLWYDAGSCVDGRLTSAWNWCSQLPDKPFYPIFKLTGFIGFDGEFK